MSELTLKSRRLTWFLIWGAVTVAPILYPIMARFVAAGVKPSPGLSASRVAFMACAAVAFTLGSFWIRRAPRAVMGAGILKQSPEGELAPPAVFQLHSIIAMALIESVSVYGCVLVLLGAPPDQSWLWSTVSVAGMVGLVLPVGLSYWLESPPTNAGPPYS